MLAEPESILYRGLMMLLAIDTSANLCAACLMDAAGTLVARRSEDIGRGHAERLMPLIGELFDEAGLTPGRPGTIGRIAVSVGPGSFTGVRVGVAVARGFALGYGCEAVGVTTLRAIAADARSGGWNGPVLSAIDARREQIYAALHDGDGRERTAPFLAPLQTLAQLRGSLPDGTRIAGSGAVHFGGAVDAVLTNRATGSIETYGRLGLAAEGDGGSGAMEARPFYLRDADAKPQPPSTLRASA